WTVLSIAARVIRRRRDVRKKNKFARQDFGGRGRCCARIWTRQRFPRSSRQPCRRLQGWLALLLSLQGQAHAGPCGALSGRVPVIAESGAGGWRNAADRLHQACGRRVQGEAARFAELDLLGHFAGPGFPVAPEVFPSTAFREPQGRQQRPESSAYLLPRNRGVAQHESLRFRYSFDRRARIAGCLASGDRSGRALVLFPVSFPPYLLGPWPLRS